MDIQLGLEVTAEMEVTRGPLGQIRDLCIAALADEGPMGDLAQKIIGIIDQDGSK